MVKKIASWTVDTLSRKYDEIYFPEYQREPNIWGRDAKQRLIDSIVRQFDIAPIYLTLQDNGVVECVDGRQRIAAIMSFLGINERDADVGFEFRVLNELYEDGNHPFFELNDWTYQQIAGNVRSDIDEVANEFVRRLGEYEVTVVSLSDVGDDNEFNLQFARLNLGMIINSGEKLNAMVGHLRDICFGDLGKHPFLGITAVPKRRYGRQQTVAQILAHVFSLENSRDLSSPAVYARTRHFDLQRLFKAHTWMGQKEGEWVEGVRRIFDLLITARDDFVVIRGRAMLVSAVMLAYTQGVRTEVEAQEIGAFIRELSTRLKWQIGKGLDVELDYRYLVEFQRHLTQASVERPAVASRAALLKTEYARWKETGELRGDREYRMNHQEEAGSVSRREIGE